MKKKIAVNILLIFFSSFSLQAQKYYIEGSFGIETSSIPISIATTDLSNSIYRLSGGKYLVKKYISLSINTSATFYDWGNARELLFLPFLKAEIGKDNKFFLYGGSFASSVFHDKNLSSETKYNNFYWGLNFGLGANFKISQKLYLIFDFREYIGLSDLGSYKETKRGSFIGYTVSYGNPSIGLGYKFIKKESPNIE